MQIFINEVSLEGQYPTDAEFKDAIIVFKSIFDLINEKIKTKQIYKEDSRLYVNYEAIKGSNFNVSLNKLRDKSLKQAFINIVFNKLNPKEWRQEQVHSSTDLFDCLISDENYINVTDTSLAEVTERKLQNSDSIYLFID